LRRWGDFTHHLLSHDLRRCVDDAKRDHHTALHHQWRTLSLSYQRTAIRTSLRVSRACIESSVLLIVQGDERVSFCVEPHIAPQIVRANAIAFDFSLDALFSPLIDPHSTSVLRDTLTEHVRVDVEFALFVSAIAPMRFARPPAAQLLDERVSAAAAQFAPPLTYFPDDVPAAGSAICRFAGGGDAPDPTAFIDQNRRILAIVPKTCVAAQLFEFVPIACLHVRCFVLVPRFRGGRRKKDGSVDGLSRQRSDVRKRDAAAKTPSPNWRGSAVMKDAMAQKTPVPYRKADRSPMAPYLAPAVRMSPRKDEAPRKPLMARQITGSQV
jgi:hypothetical protein